MKVWVRQVFINFSRGDAAIPQRTQRKNGLVCKVKISFRQIRAGDFLPYPQSQDMGLAFYGNSKIECSLSAYGCEMLAAECMLYLSRVKRSIFGRPSKPPFSDH